MKVLDLPYFLRDLVVLALMVGGILVLYRSKERLYEAMSFPEFKRSVQSLFVAFVLVAIAQTLGVISRTDVLMEDHAAFMEVRSIILVVGALLFFAAVFLLYVPFARGTFKVIKIATEVSGEIEHSAYGGDKDVCYSLFKEYVHRIPGMAITRLPPKAFRERLGLEKVPVLWLSKVDSEEAVHPTRLPYIQHIIEQFLKESDLDKVVLLDGIEYLMLENDRKAVLKFITNLRDMVELHRGLLLVPYDKESLDPKDVAFLESELRNVRELQSSS
ncbi:DUF835 domain-containing protein [Palaeococcus ferrophilus]|uniref:DUF835 domain-containing protein n=1 Tax=Palaeococcus ferrophilus TaxID=83868 RepID=UPI00064E7AA6|nr:DUF835 domain-containing protein [Palaeococcus ferrophilus]